MNRQITLQEYLSLGYVYLIILGVVHDIIYYKFFGIDIMVYSTILDVLLTPINILTRNGKVFVIFILIFIGLYYYFTKFVPAYNNRQLIKKGQQPKVVSPEDQRNGTIILMLSAIFFMFIGSGIGRGQKIAEQVATGEIPLSHRINFSTGAEAEVAIIGQNNAYIFYVGKDDTEVTIAPMWSNVNTMTILPDEEED